MKIQPGNACSLTFQSTCMQNLEQTVKLNSAPTPLTLCHRWPLSSCSKLILIPATQEISGCLHIEIFSLLSLVVA